MQFLKPVFWCTGYFYGHRRARQVFGVLLLIAVFGVQYVIVSRSSPTAPPAAAQTTKRVHDPNYFENQEVERQNDVPLNGLR